MSPTPWGSPTRDRSKMMALFRKADLEDFDAILPLKNEVHQKHAQAEPDFYRNLQNAITKEEYAQELQMHEVYVLEDNNKIIGYSFCYVMEIKDHPLILNQKIFFIDDYCVARREKRKGYGRAMFEELEKLAKAQGCTSIELNVWDFNEEAKTFYKSMQMRRTRIRMQKALG